MTQVGAVTPPGATGYAALAALPLATHDGVLGAVGLIYPGPCAFSEDERAFMLTLAQQCALALDHAKAHTAVLAERARLAKLARAR